MFKLSTVLLAVGAGASFRGSCDAVTITPENLVETMYKPIMKLSDKGKVNAWKKTGLPRRMWGIWWTSYTSSVNTYLYNAKAKTTRNGVKTTSYLGNEKVWSQPIKQGLKNNKRSGFNYEMTFSKRGGSSEVNWATIKTQQSNMIKPPWKTADVNLLPLIPADLRSAVHFPPVQPLINDFTMKPRTHCNMCGDRSGSFSPAMNGFGFGSLRESTLFSTKCKDYTTETGHVVRGEDQCWRRYSRFSDQNLKLGGVTFPRGHSTERANKDNSQFTYDVIKIVDEFGSPIQPNFDNWVAAVQTKPTFLHEGSGCDRRGTYNSNARRASNSSGRHRRRHSS